MPAALAPIAGILTVMMANPRTPPGLSEDYDCTETTEIPVTKSGGEIIRTKEVSTAWYEHKQYVNEQLDEFVDTYPLEEDDWLFFAGITATEETICDQLRMALKVQVTDEQRALDEFGDSYGGIELIIEECPPPVATSDRARATQELDDDEENDHNHDPMGEQGV